MELDRLRKEVVQAAKSRGWETHKQMGQALGVSQQYMSDVLNKRRRFSAELLREAARVFSADDKVRRRWQRWGAIEAGWQI